MFSSNIFPNNNLELKPEIITQKNNEKIGLVINSPSPSISLQQLDKIFTDASSSELVEVMSISFGI